MTTKKVFREGLLGKKLGMTHLFGEDGRCQPVTVIETGPCFVLQIKNPEKDGYAALQIGFQPRKMQRVNRPQQGHVAKAGRGAFYHVQEVRCDISKLGIGEAGHELKVGDFFKVGDRVDISGNSIGRGFAGVFKRYGIGGQPATRGTHEYRRHGGAVGCRKFPGRIFKNKRMPGHMGASKVTIQNLEVLGVNPEKNLLLVHGAVPGGKGNLVFVKKTTRGAEALRAA